MHPRVKAEHNTVALIARKNCSFSLLNELVEILHFITNDSKGVSPMTCNATKGPYLMTECLGVSMHESLVEQMSKGFGFSILCDKAIMITI